MENMKIYQAVRTAPPNALREIAAGRLKGKTDINPMWRIKELTEQFGPCGIGWYYNILSQRLEPGANGEIAAFVDIHLFVKVENEWSKPIPGSGGSMYVSKEKNGLYTDDEAFKKALTDAISVSCKALGFAADVYWDKDSTKYSPKRNATPSQPAPASLICEQCGKEIKGYKKADGSPVYPEQIADLGLQRYKQALCSTCLGNAIKAEKGVAHE